MCKVSISVGILDYTRYKILLLILDCRLLDVYAEDRFDWILIATEHTEVNLTLLHQVLLNYDSTKPQFLGRALLDNNRAIIHHYADTTLYYPDSMSGILLSWNLLEQPLTNLHDFNIDAKYEVSVRAFLRASSYLFTS